MSRVHGWLALLALGPLLAGCAGPGTSKRTGEAGGSPTSAPAGTDAAEGSPAQPGPSAAPGAASGGPGLAPDGSAASGAPGSPRSPAADQGCAGGQRCIKTSDRNEQVSLDEAREWWPYRPLLAPAGAFSTEGDEYALVATSTSGRTKGNPTAEIGQLYLLRYPKSYTVRPEGYYEMLAAGGLSLRLSTYPASQPPQARPTMNAENFVEVRGERAGVEESTKPSGNENFRMIYWFREEPDGTQVMYLIGSDPTVYTLKQVVAWANGLSEA